MTKTQANTIIAGISALLLLQIAFGAAQLLGRDDARVDSRQALQEARAARLEATAARREAEGAALSSQDTLEMQKQMVDRPSRTTP